jgi:putative sterol carrier protein
MTTAHTAHEIYEKRKLQKYEPLLKGVHGTYLFEIAGVGHWFISVRDGAIEFEEARHDADCTIRCEEADFIDIVEGRRNLITAVMQGRVKVTGDYALAQKFHGLISSKLEDKKDKKKEAA